MRDYSLLWHKTGISILRILRAFAAKTLCGSRIGRNRRTGASAAVISMADDTAEKSCGEFDHFDGKCDWVHCRPPPGGAGSGNKWKQVELSGIKWNFQPSELELPRARRARRARAGRRRPTATPACAFVSHAGNSTIGSNFCQALFATKWMDETMAGERETMKRERLRHSRVQSSTLAAVAIQIEVLFRPAKMADNIKLADGFSLGCGVGGSCGGKSCAQSRFFCPTTITGQEFPGVRVFDEDVHAKCLLKGSVRAGNDGRAGGIRRGGAHERRGLSVFRGCGCAGGKRRQGGGGEAGDDEIFHKLNYC